MKIDISEAKYIRDRYFRKRRSIQAKTSGKVKTKLLTKYSGREKRRINDILHRVSKTVAKIASDDSSFITGQCIVCDGGYTLP